MKIRLARLAAAACLKWGHNAQLGIVQEECAELIAMINRQMRGRADNRAVAAEVADVVIALESIKLIIGPELIEQAIEEKALRLAGRVDEAALTDVTEKVRENRRIRNCQA